MPPAKLRAGECISTTRALGGKFAVLTAEFNDWFASLWHGRALAGTVAVLAVAIAAACFWWRT
jgi:hypothetical protein